MTNQNSIKYISSLLDSPNIVSEGDRSGIASFVQSYPYFVPVRYLTAVYGHKKSAFSDDMLTSAKPYLGNWLLFLDFLNAATGDGRQEIFSRVPEYVAEEPVVLIYNETEPEMADEFVTDNAPDQEQIETATEAQVAEEPGVHSYNEAKPEMAYEFETAAPEQQQVEAVTEAPVVEDAPATVVIEGNMAAVSEPETEEPVFNIETENNNAISGEVAMEETGLNDSSFISTSEETVIVEQPVVEEPLILPVDTLDYFMQQGEVVPNEIPEDIDELKINTEATFGDEDDEKSLMVVMSFSEWLTHFKQTAEKRLEETAEQKALRTMWQKEKLAAALEEENDEIPENVFEMAVNSITREDGLASETLAEVYIKQGKHDKAIDMYRKLSLRNPQKSTYFARKIEEVLKDKQS